MTLTDTSKVVKKGVKIGILVIISYYIAILIIIPLAGEWIKMMFPPKDPPNPMFGPLPALEFVQKEIKNDTPPTYKLDTKDGKLPKETTKKLPVYKFIRPNPSFEKGESAINTAKEFGYNDIDMITSLKESIYKWKSLTTQGQLEINTNTKEFVIDVPISGKGDFFPRGVLNYANVSKQAIDLLKKIGRYNDPLYQEGTNKIAFGKLINTRVQQIDDVNDAQLARIDFFRMIDKYPILGPDPTQGLINLTMRRYDTNFPSYNYPFGEYHVWTIEQQTNASYPIVPINEAWEIMKNNKAVVTNVTPRNEGVLSDYTPIRLESVYINNIYLAYYDNTNMQEFLQPIWVFEGTYTTSGTQGGTVTYYYPAVTSEYIKLPENN